MYILLLSFIIIVSSIGGSVAGSIGDCLPDDCCNKAECVPAKKGELTFNSTTGNWYDRVTRNNIPIESPNVRTLNCLPRTFVCRSNSGTTTYCILLRTEM